LRLVVDSNVLLSAVGGHAKSPSAKLLDAIRRDSVQAIACPQLITEVGDGLRKPYFAARVTADEAREALDAIERLVVMLPDPPDPATVLRDRRDDYLVALARAAGADAIVTGDRDLLDHAGLTPSAITPREACEQLGLP
jgi:putative PIN family toxin of toxin-antitoxin system